MKREIGAVGATCAQCDRVLETVALLDGSVLTSPCQCAGMDAELDTSGDRADAVDTDSGTPGSDSETANARPGNIFGGSFSVDD